MTSVVKVDNKQAAADHLEVLRDYAMRVLVKDEVLTEPESVDRSYRMQAYMGIGRSYQLTESEMVSFICKGLFGRPRGCGCPSCRGRRDESEPTS